MKLSGASRSPSRSSSIASCTLKSTQSATPCLPVYCNLLSRRHSRCWSENELGIAELSHLRNVQARKFRFRRDPVTDDELDRQVDEHADREHDTDECRDAHQLRDK